MSRYLWRRLLTALVVLFLVSVITFLIVFVLPGDTAAAVLGEDGGLDPEAYEALRERLGLNKPLAVRYFDWISGVLTGDLGVSLRTKEEIGPALLRRAGPTFQLAFMAMLIAIIIAVPVGVAAAVHHNTWVDAASTVFALGGIAIPGFWLGIMLILVFAVWLRWLPPSGYVPLWEDPVQSIRLMLMPAVALATALFGVTIRQVRTSVLEVLGEDYIITARSKGITERRVIYRHALRNALLPVVTVIGLQMGHTLAGAATVEVVFSLPGLGRLAVDSIFFRDFTMLQAVMLLFATIVLTANLVTDLIYARLDPRIRYD
ncbi:ABC transporter permease [Psychromarinibacter sp. C21-152]|uniref:ABC transporter permease n=1 Tax=Psychromarinibacter sediminicola TaxID=3033385 RepID=A0AAE3NV76_9RHOB|nr:ABC transporter permease [Psychromarinibacter sediminicola]MDF0601232.1 ABC transporter permease [Psychromarinibacter sediminicola]